MAKEKDKEDKDQLEFLQLGLQEERQKLLEQMSKIKADLASNFEAIWATNMKMYLVVCSSALDSEITPGYSKLKRAIVEGDHCGVVPILESIKSSADALIGKYNEFVELNKNLEA